MKKSRILAALAAVLVAVAPFLTIQASACAVAGNETKVPKSLLE